MHLPTFLKSFLTLLIMAAITSPQFGSLKHDLLSVGTAMVLAGLHALFPSAIVTD